MTFPVGIKFDGSKCTCACHTGQAMHIAACCRPIDPSEAHTIEHYVFTEETLEQCIRWNPGVRYSDLTGVFGNERECWHAFYDAIDRLIRSKKVLVVTHMDWGASARQTISYFWMGDANIRLITGSSEGWEAVPPTIFSYDPFDSYTKERD